ncbi:tenomodulin isoform X2 [Anarrhichthys ocellatus]|uniref:tenomodulin isoform X2 n=1 Tax=Anarrhichthys ocellatus TaxID=433405 RepID=UPI0012EE4EDA|nr:tenomodulin isoform X2 [Anarrhichthys ocellatus]
MEASSKSSSQQILWKDVEMEKEKKTKYHAYQRVALILALVFLVLALCVFSLRYVWSPSLGKGITGIRFAEHQRCYIRTQTRQLPTVAEVEAEDAEQLVDETEAVDMKVEDSQVWVPAEEPIVNPAFLFDSKIWEICQELPIHWIHPSPLSDAEVGNVDAPDAEVTGQRFARDVLDHPPVNDYRDIGIELDNRLDDHGYCCQHCRRGYRYCRRYHEPLGGFNPWPYYYQGGRVICQIVMPCNWWIARMLGRI